MKILDCTLRDGGFVNDFNWDLNFAQRYYDLMSEFNINYVELGYWKQTVKSKNPFYNFNYKYLEKITKNSQKKNVSVIIDYHYCNKDFSIYPKKGQTPISLLRVTSRKQDLDEALKFIEQLQEKTQLDVAFQIINSTNYSERELTETIEKILKYNFFYVYFADSHGNLNLYKDFYKFKPSVDLLKKNNIATGFHLHNHTNRAFLNYCICLQNEISMIDTSILGLGKGGGNLSLEDIIINENFIKLIKFISKEKNHLYLKNDLKLYTTISGRLNITDNYAKEAIKKNIDIEEFYNQALLLRGVDKDTHRNLF